MVAELATQTVAFLLLLLLPVVGAEKSLTMHIADLISPTMKLGMVYTSCPL